MKEAVAMYTFGYYGGLAFENRPFWQGLEKEERFYTQFREFCRVARAYAPPPVSQKGAFDF
jgi:hypothetical protein